MIFAFKQAVLSSTVAVFLASIVSSAAALQTENPYQGIAARNVFGLKPRPAVQNFVPSTVPPRSIILTGITTILGDKRALLVINPPRIASSPQKPTPCILCEGQQCEGVKVMHIDVKAASVEVLYSGALTNLTFAKNGREQPKQPPRAPPISIPNQPHFASRVAAAPWRPGAR
jgi:hypothetical protein